MSMISMTSSFHMKITRTILLGLMWGIAVQMHAQNDNNSKTQITPDIDTLVAPLPDNGGRKVIIHVVPWYPPSKERATAGSTLAAGIEPRQARVDQHVLKMKEYGIDVIALDVQVRDSWRPGGNPAKAIWQDGIAMEWMDAIERLAPEMRFVLQLDRKPYPDSDEYWPAIIDALYEAFTDNPVYLRENGRPVLLTFFINERVPLSKWETLLLECESDFFLVANPVENPRKLNHSFTRQYIDQQEMDGMAFLFDAIEISPLGAHLSWLQASNEAIGKYTAEEGKPVIHGVSTGYYRKRVAFIEPRYDYLDGTWRMAIDSDDRYAIIYTWNDVAEDHDVYPSIMKDEAMLELNKIYIDWFKSGHVPRDDEDKIFINYPVSNSGRRITTGGEDPTYPNMNYWAFVKSPCTLNIDGVGSVSLKAGMNLGQIGPVSPGEPGSFQLVRDGQAIMQGTVDEPMIDLPEGEDLRYRWVALHRVEDD